MAEITAALVKDLREKTGAGMMDCKKALTEAGGDMEAAVDWLRKKGLAAAAKKSGRVAAEGLVGVASAPGRAAMVEVNAETDFVARNDTFQAFVAAVAQIALQVGEDLEAIKAAPFPGTGRTVAEELTQLVATIGENMTIRRASVLSVEQRRGGDLRAQRAEAGPRQDRRAGGARGRRRDRRRWRRSAARSACMSRRRRPEALDIAGVDPAALEREKAVLTEQARASGKPEDIIEKMVEGRIRKYYEEVVLLEQVWVHDGESRVKAVVKKAGVQPGRVRPLPARRRHRQAGRPDFAAEVAAAAGTTGLNRTADPGDAPGRAMAPCRIQAGASRPLVDSRLARGCGAAICTRLP